MHPLGRISIAAHGITLAALAVPAVRWPALGALAIFETAFTWELLRPGDRIFCPNRKRLPAKAGAFALTFDDGPRAEETERLLDALGEAGVRAAFFFVGRRAKALPAPVRRAAAEGHVIGNHTYTHPVHWSVAGRRRVSHEVGETQAVLADITGSAPRFFRPPMGHKNIFLAEVLEANRLEQVTWSLRSFDTIIRETRRVRKRVAAKARAGDIILLHEGLEDRRGGALSLKTLGPLLEDLSRLGLRAISLQAFPPDPEGSRPAAPPSGRP